MAPWSAAAPLLAIGLLAAGCGGGGDDDGSTPDAATVDGGGGQGVDAAAVDAAAADAAAAFACGASTCDPAGQYCYEIQAGARSAAAPAAAAAGTGCRSLPAQCDAPVSCECVLAHSHDGCPLEPTCEADGDRLTVICGLP
jgi:hypothetical protein